MLREAYNEIYKHNQLFSELSNIVRKLYIEIYKYSTKITNCIANCINVERIV